MIEEIYERLYQHVGGRPWTQIIRDSWCKSPIIWFFAVLGIGSIVGHLFWFDRSGMKEYNDDIG